MAGSLRSFFACWAYLALLGVIGPAFSEAPIGVFMLGDTIPDQSFLRYDPAMCYTVIPYPTFNLLMFEDQAEAMSRHVRMYFPREKGDRFWETFAGKWQFVVDLPYLASYPLQDSPYEEAKRDLVQYISGGLANCAVSVLTSPTRSSMVDYALPYRGRLVWDGVEDDPVGDVPFDLLGGSPRDDFALEVSDSTIFEQFEGLGLEDYHDASLLLLAHPLSRTEIPISINLSEGLKMRLGAALGQDPGALRDGLVPWLMYCNVSKTQEYKGAFMEEVFSHAGGLSWACASPINGPFFFPTGGYVASSPAYNPRHPPSVDRVSLSEEHPYAWDLVSTMIYYSCGRDIPDLLEAHEIRTLFAAYWSRYVDVLHVLDWVEDWREGPVVSVVWRDLEEVEGRKAEAAELYIEEEYDRSRELIQEALQIVAEAEKHAQMSLTDALAWVYMIEGLTVTSTALIAGSITLYFVGADRSRPVNETRLRKAVDRSPETV